MTSLCKNSHETTRSSFRNILSKKQKKQKKHQSFVITFSHNYQKLYLTAARSNCNLLNTKSSTDASDEIRSPGCWQHSVKG